MGSGVGEEEVQNIEGWFDLIRLETTPGEEPKYAKTNFKRRQVKRL